jgi:hypothetical protein
VAGDTSLVDYIAEEFKKENGIDLKNDKQALQRLKDAAEKAKIELSSAQETDVSIPFVTADATGPKHIDLKMSRSKLESLVQGLIDKTFDAVKAALKDAKIESSKVDEVVLVGGMTRMPAVQAAVEKFFGKEPHKGINPDEVGIVVCNFLCGINYVEKQSRILREEGPQNISKYLSLAFFPCGTAGMISLIHQIKGYSNTLGGIESSGEQAIQLAEEALKNGKAKFMLVGATEAPLIDLFRQGYAQKYGDQAANHLSEASCFLVLEKKRTALERNVPVLASLNDLKQMMGAPLFSALRYSLCGDALSANHFIEFAFKILKADEFLNKRELLKDFSKELNRQSISKTKEVEQNAIF